MAKLDGVEIKTVARYGKNGKYYEWNEPTQKKLESLVKKYGVDSIEGNGLVWLQW